ncbi:SNF1-related protein kinase regulatory subunit gamma-like PV42a [Platanthera zijinensis]|uniref:SNF1-related protein kinase regulatory subunit gamma-like PV42a n=1 Tax=Platanthera zijinensis TaxID=2320716 RepID=A0AAP0GCY5_9ASPA
MQMPSEERLMEETLTLIHRQHPDELASSSDESNKKMRRSSCGWLRDRKVADLVRDSRRLVEVPYTATLAATVHALVANDIAAVPVAAPPGRYIGAGGSMILESDRATGVVRKHYIGIITMLDVLVHIADGHPDGDGAVDLETKMAVPVSTVIGQSLEGLNLWTLNPNTSILDCIETFSKGVHRSLVPLESQMESAISVELVEASPGYRMLTQLDVLNFLRANANELQDIMNCSIGKLAAVNENVFAVSEHTHLIDAIRSMSTFSLGAVPIVAAAGEVSEDGSIIQDGRGRKVIGTFSATDLRRCSVAQLQSMLNDSVISFKEQVSAIAAESSGISDEPKTRCVTCHYDSTLAEVIDEAVFSHVHRVWVVDGEGLLVGLVSLTDILRAILDNVLGARNEVQDAAPIELQV